MRRAIVLGALIAVGTLSLTVAAYQGQGRGEAPSADRVIPEMNKITDNLYIIGLSRPEDKGFTGGNTLLWITEKGVVVVDTKNPTWGQMILDKIKTVTSKPVIMVLNSHGHSDHAGSNVELPPPPAVEYIVHENIVKMWSQDTCTNVGNCEKFKGENAKYLPKRTFKDKLSVLDGKDRIDLYWFGRGHTNGDTWVVIPSARTMHVGDLYRPRVPPFIDVANGASGAEFPETLRKGVAGISGIDRVVPGHGPVMTFADLTMHRDFMQDLLKRVQDGIKANKTVEQLVKEYPMPSPFKGYMEGEQQGPGRKALQTDMQIMYDELTKKK
jgi:cyclase